MRQIHTDLAMEAFQASGQENLPGVQINQWEESGVTMTEVMVETEEAAGILGKPIGSYLTLEAPMLRERDPDVRIAVSNLLGEEIGRMLAALGIEKPDGENPPILVVGLGNRLITPDSLGPMTVDRVLVTRHILRELPEFADRRMRSVCAIAPGVLGITGVETVEMVESLSAKLKPAAVVCVDSLSARSSSRIGIAIQMTDAGIQPGSGVGNHRRALTKSSLGCEVVAIGMPTVIYAATLARDAMEYLGGSEESQQHEQAFADIERELLQCSMGEMIVTPREIDSMVEDAAQVIAMCINKALQPELSDEEIATMMD